MFIGFGERRIPEKQRNMRRLNLFDQIRAEESFRGSIFLSLDGGEKGGGEKKKKKKISANRKMM